MSLGDLLGLSRAVENCPGSLAWIGRPVASRHKLPASKPVPPEPPAMRRLWPWLSRHALAWLPAALGYLPFT